LEVVSVYGEARKVVYFNLARPEHRRLWEFSKSIQFGHEIRQFLALRMRGVPLEQLIANAAQRDTLTIDTSKLAGGDPR
jgi:hypothetical protein